MRPGSGKRGWGNNDAALAMRRDTGLEAAALRQAAEVGRAAGDRVYVAITRLTVEARSPAV